MGKHSRDKGKRGEREACEVMRDLWPKVRRRAMQARGGAEGADLENTPGYHVEVGCGNVNPRAKWEQADRDSEIDQVCGILNPNDEWPKVPIALTRKDRGEWIVTMSAEDWKALVRKATSHGEGKSEREPEAQGESLRCNCCLLEHRAGEGCGDAVQRAIRGEQPGDQ